jgi:hypothetical protein
MLVLPRRVFCDTWCKLPKGVLIAFIIIMHHHASSFIIIHHHSSSYTM